jgi:hypothetical protein
MPEDEPRAVYRLRTYVEQLGGSANWHTLCVLVGPELQVGSAGSCHRTLTLGKGATPGKATSDEIPERVIARIRLKGRLSTNDQTGKIEVRAVEDLALI